MKETLTVKERWLAALRMQPVDRLPFWPKLSGAYPQAQAAPFRDMTVPQLHAWIGSDPHMGVPGCLREVRKTTSVTYVREAAALQTLFKGPGGELEMVQHYDPSTQSWHPVQFPVRTRDDIRTMTRIVQDADFEVDAEALQKARDQAREIGHQAITVNTIGTSPLMHWVEYLAGVEAAHYLLADCPEEVESLFDALHAVNRRKAELLCAHSPADALYMMENTSTTLISPDQFRRYCAPHLADYAAIAKSRDRLLILHMCGHLKALLPDLARIPARAFEAFTAPTLGNTTLLDGRTQCPDKCLIGGTHAMLWTRSTPEIIAGIAEALAPLPHHRGLVVTSAGVMPPSCTPETIKAVCDWVKEFRSKPG